MAMLLGPLDEPFLAFLIAHLQRTDGMSRTLATAIAMLTVVGAAVGALEQARRAPPNPPLVRPALVAGSVTSIALAPTAVLVLPGALVFGFGMIGFWTALQARVLLLRPGQAGTVSAVVSTIEFAGFLHPGRDRRRGRRGWAPGGGCVLRGAGHPAGGDRDGLPRGDDLSGTSEVVAS